MGHAVVSKRVAKRCVIQSTKASASLECRTVPAGFVRPPRVERSLAAHRQRG